METMLTSLHNQAGVRRQRRALHGRVRGSRAATQANLAQLQKDAGQLRMGLSDAALVQEALAVNHSGTCKKTRTKYAKHLEHFSGYLASTHQRNFYTAKLKHVKLFLNHLEEKGGSTPDPSRRCCAWCRDRGYPDGTSGEGWAASTRKSYKSAIGCLYGHFMMEEDLPDHNPTHGLPGIKVVTRVGWSPSREEIESLLSAPGRPRDRLIAHWITFAPSRRQPFAEARWRNLDLDEGTWDLVGKGNKADIFDLHPRLVRVLRQYRRWQLKEAEGNPAIAEALADEETAFVLLTRTGRPVTGQTVAKMLKWRAVRAGVGVVKTAATHDAPNGVTSKLSPQALRRAWANLALNDPHNPVPLDVVSQVLHHADIGTTRRHYAQTKPERARKALREFNL